MANFTGYPPGGTINCAVFESSTVILESPEQLKTLAKSAVFIQDWFINSRPGLSINFTFTGLIPSLSYDVFCAGEDSYGNMLSIGEITEAKQTATTACCRQISYINAPVFVYENLDSYFGVSSTDLYVYTYSIQMSAGKTLSVSPFVLVQGTQIVTNAAVISPSSITFSNTKSFLQTYSGSFIITGTPGTYTVMFSLVGASKIIYNLDKGITVSILADLYDPPFPILKSARFVTSGSSIIVSFDSPTDQAAYYSSTLNTKIAPVFKCDLVFLFKSSSSSICSWNNDSSLVISFEFSSNIEYLNIGDLISFRSNVIKAACKKNHNTTRCDSYSYAPNSSSILVLGPISPLTPNVIITSPKKISACDNLTLDASSSSGMTTYIYIYIYIYCKTK